MVIQDGWLVWLRLFLFALRLPRKKKKNEKLGQLLITPS